MSKEIIVIPYPNQRFPYLGNVQKKAGMTDLEVDLGGDQRRSRFTSEYVEEKAQRESNASKQNAGQNVNLGGDDRSPNGFFPGEHIEIE